MSAEIVMPKDVLVDQSRVETIDYTAAMLTTKEPQSKIARIARRQLIVHTGLGTIGLTSASLLLYPKVVALMAGNLAVIGVGTVANLALVFGSLMFLREAQRARAKLASPGDEPSRGK